MSAHGISEQRSAVARIGGLFTWFGGGQWRELGERHERSNHAVAGVVVALGAVLAWLVADLVVHESVRLPWWTVLAAGLVFGLLVGAVTRGTVSGPAGGRLGVAGRVGVAIAVGVIVGELASVVMFSGSIDRRLDEHSLRAADSTPAVAQAAATLQQARDARAALDNTVDQARGQVDKALIVARCEYNPSPACPQTRITGIPGQGPETRSSNELLADAQRELDNALATRDRRAPELDAAVARDEQALAAARHAAISGDGGGLGARWVAMNELTLASAGALVLRMLTLGFFALLYLLPLILRLWRGETTHDRHAAARAERERAEFEAERAELEADTAIAIKRAEVRRAAEIMWAEHQLTQTRLAIEAQAEIDREQQRRRVAEALEAPVRALAERTFTPALESGSKSGSGSGSESGFESGKDDMYLPIAAEAEAASRAVAELPAGAQHPNADRTESAYVERNLPAPVEESGPVAPRQEERAPLIPSLPDATKAAARWIRPLVPPFVARVIDNTTAPLRSARQVFEEVEEIAFSLKRTRKVTVNTESSEGPEGSDDAGRHSVEAATGAPRVDANRIESSRGYMRDDDYGSYGIPSYERLGTDAGHRSLHQTPTRDLAGLSATPQDRRRELVEREGPRELRAPDGPRELPPGK